MAVTTCQLMILTAGNPRARARVNLHGPVVIPAAKKRDFVSDPWQNLCHCGVFARHVACARRGERCRMDGLLVVRGIVGVVFGLAGDHDRGAVVIPGLYAIIDGVSNLMLGLSREAGDLVEPHQDARLFGR
jgi:hypothetical protein